MHLKNLQLSASVVIIIPVALAYGLYPAAVMQGLFSIKIETVNLTSIFRSIMGLYFGISVIWIIGIAKPQLWVAATITNIVFMGGLAAGRLLSLLVDGTPSKYFLAGLLLEILLAFWGLFNLKKYKL